MLQRRCRLVDPSGLSYTRSETPADPSIYYYSAKKRARRRPAADPSAASTHDHDNLDVLDASQGETTEEWREWTSLEPGIVDDIAGRLLSLDVSEYLRLRASCKYWRTCTADPHVHGGGLDSRFRPRNWIAMSHCSSSSSPSHPTTTITLLNVATGARFDVDLSDLFSTHHLHSGSSADGLLVLRDKATNAIHLLNPLTRALVEFPPITDVEALEVPPGAYSITFRANFNLEVGSTKVHVPSPPPIKGAGMDDATSPPTLVLCLRKKLSHVVVAKPGVDAHWVSVHHGEQQVDLLTGLGRILFQSLLSLKGRCYFTTARGDVMTLDLGPMTVDRWGWSAKKKPCMVYLLREMALADRVKAMSYLVRSHDDRTMLMVRYSFSHHGGLTITDNGDGNNPVKTFISKGAPSRMEVFKMDIGDGRGRLIPLQGIGSNAAVFVGDTHSIMLSTVKFPKIAANTVYMNYLWQRVRLFGTYRFEDGKTTPPRDLRRYKEKAKNLGFWKSKMLWEDHAAKRSPQIAAQH
nr:unnamed protein product [Digitaria exilis]